MKSKAGIFYMLASLCFMSVGVINAIDHRLLDSLLYFIISILFIVLTITIYKASTKKDKNVVALTDIDDILRKLIAEGHKTKAIKYYRKETGVGLKEAYDYILNLKANMTTI